MRNLEDISTTFNPNDIEDKWYEAWEKGGHFKAKKGFRDETFSIIMPPPNVTGRLHAGHALDITTQDSLIRYKRMKGFETLWIPGMDHAGIATQNIVEKLVWKEEKKKRQDFSREEFVKKIWKWKEEYGGIIVEQQKKMGASPDWDYSLFTLDEDACEAVKKAFVTLYNEGLIYQSDYIINWDPVLQSAISDAEVEHIEINGAFYHLLYKIKDSDETIEIATTRPETLLGDTAVSVHPEDERFKHLIGKTAIVPLCNREVKIIADDYVDMEKGTGCLKVTPGHDFNDFEIGKRHNLEIINILNKDATLNEKTGQFQGMNVKEARKAIVQKLKDLDQLKDIKNHIHQVGHGDRSKAVIEPLVSKQWFVDVKEMAKEAVKAIETGETQFVPKGWENTYFSWLREPKNWCISRQLWWGHQIPVFNCIECQHQWASEKNETACPNCSSKNVEQDPDVLDTWFSSGLWPFSTLGWPNEKRMKEKGLDKFFPGTVLITGFDIIFFWVARMMMMSKKLTKKIPFEKIYIHAIVRDKQGRKMSKSLGNGIDPLETVAEYGADAFRFTLAAGSGYNRTLNLDPERITGNRNFMNKIWNAFRFISPFLESAKADIPDSSDLTDHEKWILNELNETAKVMNKSLDIYRFDDASSAIYQFVYEKFCSWFIELSKPILHGDNSQAKEQRATVLKFCFKNIVALLHPISPYLTEELWSYLKDEKDNLLISSSYPEYTESLCFPENIDLMEKFIEVITSIRNLRSSVNIKPKEEIKTILFTDDNVLENYFNSNASSFFELAKVKNLTIKRKSEDRPSKSIVTATSHSEIFIPLQGIIDLNEQIKRLTKEKTKIEKEVLKLEKKINNEKFISSAPQEIVDKVKSEHADFTNKLTSLDKNIKSFQD